MFFFAVCLSAVCQFLFVVCFSLLYASRCCMLVCASRCCVLVCAFLCCVLFVAVCFSLLCAFRCCVLVFVPLCRVLVLSVFNVSNKLMLFSCVALWQSVCLSSNKKN
ncbi:hypothetical protein EDC96DRAFT_507063 [Choanephora cucurbitarum]|nr:hypothetical protein EDC96DRAFT_507063 [Choanephora cucurbitarum]